MSKRPLIKLPTGAVLLIFFGVLSVSGILAACSSSPAHNAPDRNFYFEIINHPHPGDTFAIQLSGYLARNISKHKYTITGQSGTHWPFYKELSPRGNIPADSLMPPHWFVHRMIPMMRNQRLEIDEYLVRIDLVPQRDTLPNYSVQVFKMDTAGLVLTGSSGIHYVGPSDFPPDVLPEYFLKSIIRYSFK